jgi:hypothetical protein
VPLRLCFCGVQELAPAISDSILSAPPAKRRQVAALQMALPKLDSRCKRSVRDRALH